MRARTISFAAVAFMGVLAAAAERPAEPAFLARDRSLELPTPYVAPPGDPLEHHAAGFAQIMWSAVFITGLDADFADLYLQDGVWKGRRILPEGFVKFVSTPAPAWVADGRPIYGGFFWINGDGKLPIPKNAYYMAGAGGQSTTIIPSHDLVVVRLGHFKGDEAGSRDLSKSLALLMEAVPAHR